MSKAKLTKVTVKLPWIEGEWVADEVQQKAAWEMYVELVTRITVQPLAPQDGLLREALASFYALFGETRRILRSYGPDVAIPHHKNAVTFGQLAVEILNRSLRPLLAKWHPLLLAYESSRPPERSPVDHERAWPEAAALRSEIEARRQSLLHYASLLANVCRVPPLHDAE
jgi:hypothetical protein